ncbi:hypothetical protein UJ101_00841 [Flavobacteriaceae bacterium UJ101]|nr:hypothetical protein UJ101_00841 [Flavobacteriaceae bacterium UJ101]
MGKNTVITLIITFTTLFIACSTPKPVVEKPEVIQKEKVEEIVETPPKPSVYDDILSQNLTLKVEGQYLPLTLITFTNTKSDLVGKKRIYELYGDWEKAINLSTSKHPLLVWKNIPLLDNDFKMMTIIADGKLVNNINQISFFIYDSKTKENLLADNSPYKERITKKITQLLETNDPKNKAFEKKFWKDFYFVDIYEGE